MPTKMIFVVIPMVFSELIDVRLIINKFLRFSFPRLIIENYLFPKTLPQLRGRLYEMTYKVDMAGNFPTLNTRSTSLVIFDLKSFHKSADGLFIPDFDPPIVCSYLISST